MLVLTTVGRASLLARDCSSADLKPCRLSADVTILLWIRFWTSSGSDLPSSLFGSASPLIALVKKSDKLSLAFVPVTGRAEFCSSLSSEDLSL